MLQKIIFTYHKSILILNVKFVKDILSPNQKPKVVNKACKDSDVRINKRLFESNTEKAIATKVETEGDEERDIIDNVTIKCGVCQSGLQDDKKWILHIQVEHNYLAWKEGELAIVSNTN